MSDDFAPFPSRPESVGPGPLAWVALERRPSWRARFGRWFRSPAFHLLLFSLTAFTTLCVGAHMAGNFARHLPAFDLDLSPAIFLACVKHPSSLVQGIPFAFSLLAILLAHEFGHYFACRYYRLHATLPYFMPAPTLIGTFGAFIRIHTRIPTRRALFDVGIAGPIAGFVVAIPTLAAGLAQSTPPAFPSLLGSVRFGRPLALTLVAEWLRPGFGVEHLLLSPVACAAWVGLLVTALNLLPMGQLDGGHILYALLGDRHKILSRGFFLALLPLGIFYWTGWIMWAALMLLIGLRHPAVLWPDETVGRGRWWLAVFAAAMFVLCFIPAPFSIR